MYLQKTLKHQEQVPKYTDQDPWCPAAGPTVSTAVSKVPLVGTIVPAVVPKYTERAPIARNRLKST